MFVSTYLTPRSSSTLLILVHVVTVRYAQTARRPLALVILAWHRHIAVGINYVNELGIFCRVNRMIIL